MKQQFQHFLSLCRLLTLQFFLVLICLPSGIQASNLTGGEALLRSASEYDYPPFAVVLPDGTAGGFSVELLQAVVEAVGRKITFKIGPWHELKEELATGKLDVLPLVSFSTERHLLYDFTAPYLRMNGTVFVRKDNTDIKEIEDLKGKEVLVMEGDTAHEYVVQMRLTDKIITASSYEEAFKLLADGHHDAVVVQQVVGLQILKKLQIKNVVAVQKKNITSLKPVALKLDGFEQNFCFAVQEGNLELLSQLNEGLSILYLDGTYETLYKKWFAPILPPLQPSILDMFKKVISILIPLCLLFTLAGLWYLRKLVAKRTRFLEEEIWQRHLIEKQLEESNANYIKAQQIGKVGNWQYTIATQHFFGSMEAKRLYGFDQDSDSFTVEAVESCIPERERVHKALVDLIERDVPYNLEFDILPVNSDERRTIHSIAELERDASGYPLKIHGVIRDITAGKKAAEELQRSERLLNEMGAIARIGGWEHDVTTRKATWTQEIFTIVDHESQSALGPEEHLRSFLPEDRPILEKHYLEAVKNGRPFDLTLRYITEKGRFIWVRVIGHPLYGNGKCIKIRGTFQDITEIKKMEEHLMQSQRLESIGVLAGGIAHDFNNILSAILGFTELARDANPSNPQLQDDLNEIFIAGKRAKELVQQILTFSSSQESISYPINITLIVKEVAKMLRSTLPASLEVVVDIGNDIPAVLADPTQLHQVIMNLCTNASQSMENQNGILTIKVAKTTLEKTMLGRGTHLVPGDYVKMSIEDTGCGITPQIIGSIFDPYFTTKHLGDGTGLGLAVTHSIVQRLRGEISVASVEGKGTVFTVLLPAADPIMMEQSISDTIDHSLPGGKERILLVDDELPILKYTTRILEKYGYSVTALENGEAAFEKFMENPALYDLIISDVTMPRLSGDALAHQILAVRPDIPILLATGYSKKVSDETILQSGARTLLHKPVTEEQLLKKIIDVLDIIK